MHYRRAILILLLTTGFVWHTQAANTELAPVEERLKGNLENRILIFRERGIEGRHIRFDTSERPLHRAWGDPMADPLDNGPARGPRCEYWMESGCYQRRGFLNGG